MHDDSVVSLQGDAGAPPGGFATIEDLDPEPALRPARLQRREVLLGLLLLGVLAGFSLVQWWDQGGKLSAYQAGQRAASAHDWPAAQAAFRAAGDYGDAGARAQSAARMATDHAAAAQHAMTAAAAGNWPLALAAAQQALALVPADPQMVPLAHTAEQHVAPLALTGTVALRLGVTPAGLYAYSPTDWYYLAQSDSLSRVRATCPDGDLLYDVRDPAVPPSAPPAPGLGRRPNAALTNRLIVVADQRGRVHQTLAFEPTQFYRYLCTESGVWAFRPAAAGRGSAPVLASPILVGKYQALGARAAITPTLPGPDWSMVAVSADGRHLLALDPIGGDGDTAYRLAQADPDGSGLRVVHTGTGTVEAVDWSGDGRWVLLSVDQVRGPAVHRVVLLCDVTGHQPDATVLQADIPPDQPATWSTLPPGFIKEGPRAGQVLLVARPASRLDPGPVSLSDPLHPGLPNVTLQVSGAPAGAGLVRQDRASGALIAAWWDGTQAAAGATIAVLDPAGRPRFFMAPLAGGVTPTDVLIRDGRLVYTTSGAEANSGQRGYTVHALPLTGGTTGPASSVFTSTTPPRQYGRSGTDLALRFGPGLLAYVTPGNELRGRTYDGAVDVLLEKGVSSLFDLAPDLTPTVARMPVFPGRFTPPITP